MKILVFAPFFPPDPTGSSIFAQDQCRELQRLGHDVMVVTNDVDREAPELNSSENVDMTADLKVLRVKCLRVNLGRITWNYRIPMSFLGMVRKSSRQILKKYEADAVIVHSTLFDLSLWALIWCALKKKKVILVSHTALWHDQRFVNFLMRSYGHIILKPLVKWSSAKVVCVDKWTYQNAIQLFSTVSGTTTIPVSINLGTMADGDGNRIREKHDLRESPIILSLGHVVPLRNRVNLVRSLPLLIGKYPSLRVIIVGEVRDEKFLEEAQRLGVRRHLVLTGAVSHNEIKDYLAVADVESHDLDGKGLGITSVEAMDAGVPIIAWVVDDNYPGISLRSYEVTGFVEDGEPATISNAIDKLISDPDVRYSVIAAQEKLIKDLYSCFAVNQAYLSLLA